MAAVVVNWFVYFAYYLMSYYVGPLSRRHDATPIYGWRQLPDMEGSCEYTE